MVKLNGSSFALQYKRTTSRPIDSSDVWDTLEDARVYARNCDTEVYVPYAGQIISVVENGFSYQLIEDTTVTIYPERKHYKLVKIGNANDIDDAYLSRDKEDTAKKLIHFLEGIDAAGVSSIEDIKLIKDLLSANYVKGSNGFGIYKDDNGKYHLDIDNATIRGKFSVETLEVKQSYHVQGAQYLTRGGLIVTAVNGNTVTMTNKDAEGRQLYNTFRVGDYAYHKEFDTSIIREYWYEVTAVSDNTITMNVTGTVPQVGDSIVQLGNKSDTSRQAAIVLDADGIMMYKGISSNTSLPTPYIQMTDGKIVFRGQFISEATGEDIDETIAALDNKINIVKSQTDREYTMWFFDYNPSLANLPASDWTTTELKSEHDQDLFYNTVNGHAWRFENGEWKEITDQFTIKALENASKAQDTADSKRRVFVSQPPSDAVYDIGDMWVNAVYDDGTTIYDNDSLVCITAKTALQAFSISHWKPASKATTAYLENLGSQIITIVGENTNRDTAIQQAQTLAQTAKDTAASALDNAGVAYDLAESNVTAIQQAQTLAQTAKNTADSALDNAGAAYDLAESNVTAIQQTKDSITLVAAQFNEDGTLKDTSGLVTTAVANVLFSNLFTTDEDGHLVVKDTSGIITSGNLVEVFVEKTAADGYAKKSYIDMFVTENADGTFTSKMKVSAEDIDFTAENFTIGAEKIDFTAENFTIGAEKISFIGKTIINDKFIVAENGSVTMNDATMNNCSVNGTFSMEAENGFKMQIKPRFDTEDYGGMVGISPNGHRIFQVLNTNIEGATYEEAMVGVSKYNGSALLATNSLHPFGVSCNEYDGANNIGGFRLMDGNLYMDKVVNGTTYYFRLGLAPQFSGLSIVSYKLKLDTNCTKENI